MTDTNCTDVLINAPKLMDDLPKKLSLAESFNKSPVFSLFKGGMKVSKLLNFNCFSNTGVAEVKPPNKVVDKLRLKMNYKEGACYVNIVCPF